MDFEGVPARVMTAEHLAAIDLQTGRAKDYARLLAFIESGALETERMSEILQRHALTSAWERFEVRCLSNS